MITGLLRSVVNKITAYKKNRKDLTKQKTGKYFVHSGAKLYDDVTVGKHTYISHFTVVNNGEIGNYCSIGPHCTIGFGDHPVGLFTTSPLLYYNTDFFSESFTQTLQEECNKKVKILNDVWIGSSVFIKNGVRIGNGAIIGAGAVVLSDVEDFSVVVGCPAKHVRYRFEPDTIEKIKATQWWELEIEKLKTKMNTDPRFSFLKEMIQYKI